jgi:ATP-binding cassette subfamily F protein uup
LIAGRRQAQAGRIELGSTVKLAYFDQHSHHVLDGTDAAGRQRKVIDVVKEAASTVELEGSTLSASQLLERFLFPPAQQHQPVTKLSGGERRRLHLCRLLIEAPNVLLLDEPTNDLDVQTLTVLEDFLEDFRGCVVVVSHDRYFLDRTVDRLFCFEEGRLERFEGNYSSYLERQPSTASASQAATAKPLAEQAATTEATPPQAKPAAVKVRRRSFKETRELEQLDAELPRWEEQRSSLEAQMAAGGSDYAALEALSEELSTLLERIARGEERWLELSELAG